MPTTCRNNTGKARVLDQSLKTSDKASCVGGKTEPSPKWGAQPPSGIALFKTDWGTMRDAGKKMTKHMGLTGTDTPQMTTKTSHI